MESQLLAFLGVAALLTISPGADMALVTRNAIANGRGAALRTTLGICAGLLTWAIASALGLAALLSASATAFLAVKVAGAVYLVVLGLATLRRVMRREGGAPVDRGAAGTHSRAASSAGAAGRSFRQGLLTNLLNPKIAVFYTTVLPQFISPDDPALVMSLTLALVHVSLSLIWLSGYAYALTRAGDLLSRPGARRAVDAVTGSVLIALGLRLAAAER